MTNPNAVQLIVNVLPEDYAAAMAAVAPYAAKAAPNAPEKKPRTQSTPGWQTRTDDILKSIGQNALTAGQIADQLAADGFNVARRSLNLHLKDRHDKGFYIRVGEFSTTRYAYNPNRETQG